MTGTPTTNWGFPTYDGTEPGSLKTVSNAQANAAETAMNNASKSFYLRYTTRALMLANVTAAVGQHATVYSDTTTAYNGDYYYTGTKWSTLGAGLNILTPSGSVGLTVGANGSLLFSSVTTLSVNGCFSTAFDNYLVKVFIDSHTSTNFNVRLRTGGVDATGSDYGFLIETVSGSALTASSASGFTTMQVHPSFTGRSDIDIRFAAPALAKQTLIRCDSVEYSNASTFATGRSNGGHNLSVAYDGFTLYCANAASGTLRVYGYNNG